MQSFRNLADAELALPAQGFVLVGPNGHGKTNFLEALLYVEVFRSFRGARDRELVRFGAGGLYVEADITAHRVAAGYDVRTRTKRVSVDGLVAGRMTEAIGVVRGVVLSPSDVALVSGEPRERRRYLDVMLALTVRGYVEALGEYRRALRQRRRAGPAEMPAWEEVLAETGARVTAARRGWADRWRERYAEHDEGVGGEAGPRLEYVASVDGDAGALRAALERTRGRDLARGRTSVGPHRDELRMTLDGRSLRTYGSAGQRRTAALALRLCEAETLRAATGEAPAVCLDDAFAELDAERSRRLGELVGAMAASGSQVFATVPREGEVPEAVSALPRWVIRDGVIGER